MATSSSSASACRAAVAARCRDDSCPAAWRAAAATAGVSGADALLCHMSLSIATALESVPQNAEAVLAQLRSNRALLHATVDFRCNALEADVAIVESAKTCALERELCVVDGALEHFRAARGTAGDALEALGDVEFVSRFEDLSARLDAAEKQLQAMSHR